MLSAHASFNGTCRRDATTLLPTSMFHESGMTTISRCPPSTPTSHKHRRHTHTCGIAGTDTTAAF
jgi:hypothetical protein